MGGIGILKKKEPVVAQIASFPEKKVLLDPDLAKSPKKERKSLESEFDGNLTSPIKQQPLAESTPSKQSLEVASEPKPKTPKKELKRLESEFDGWYWQRKTKQSLSGERPSISPPPQSQSQSQSTPPLSSSTPSLSTSSQSQSSSSSWQETYGSPTILSDSSSSSQKDIDLANTNFTPELDGVYWVNFNPSAKRARPSVAFAFSKEDQEYWSTRNAKKAKKVEREETEEQKEKRLEKQRTKREEGWQKRMEEDERIRLKEEKSKVGKKIFEVEGFNLFLGGKKVAKNKSFFQENGITAVVNVTSELENFHTGHGVQYLKIEIQDSHDTNIFCWFSKASQFIDDSIRSKNVLVHCSEGKSRSPSIVIAYAMTKLKIDLQHAYHLVKQQVPELKINDGFKLQLMNYEMQLTGKNSLDFNDVRKKRRSSLEDNPKKDEA